jgi:hypothetical protein
MRGNPAVSVPAGQMYLQKAGSPMPAQFRANNGSAMTKTASMKYLPHPAILQKRVFVFVTL